MKHSVKVLGETRTLLWLKSNKYDTEATRKRILEEGKHVDGKVKVIFNPWKETNYTFMECWEERRDFWVCPWGLPLHLWSLVENAKAIGEALNLEVAEVDSDCLKFEYVECLLVRIRCTIKLLTALVYWKFKKTTLG